MVVAPEVVAPVVLVSTVVAGAVPDRMAATGATAHPQMAKHMIPERVSAVTGHPPHCHAPRRPRMSRRALKRIAPPVRTDNCAHPFIRT